MRVTIYTKPGCSLCEDALVSLDRLTPQYGLEVHEVNILDDVALYEAYHLKIPVVRLEEGRLGTLEAPIDEAGLRAAFDIARRALPPPAGPRSKVPGPKSHKDLGPGTLDLGPSRREPFLDRLAAAIGRNWLLLACIAFGVFVGLPWLAPVFAMVGWWGLADPIYTAYALTCHQLPERAGTVFGYQVAFCFRNTALYGGALLFGIIYGLARRREVAWLRWLKKPMPWWGLVPLLLPMAVDGFTHMLGLRDTMAYLMMNPKEVSFGSFFIGSQAFSFNWWTRILTGLPAALGVVWFAYPRMSRVVEESEALRLTIYQRSA